MKLYEIGTGYTPIPARVAAATESVVEELTKALLSLGEDVTVLDVAARSRAATDLPIVEIPVPAVFTGEDVALGLRHKLKRVVYSICLARKLKKLLKREPERPVLHFHNQYNLFFFLKMTTKRQRRRAIVAYTNHNGLWSLPWEEAKDTLHKRYFQEIAAMRASDVVFVLNRRTRETVVSRLGLPADRVVLTANGVNADIFRPLPEADRLRIREALGLSGKTVILQAGSVNENKGQLRALRLLEPLLKEHPDLVYAFVGGIVSQEYFDLLQSEVSEKGLTDQVRYLGTVSPGEAMNELYNAASAVILASHYEGLPLVGIESMAAEAPVLLLASDALAGLGDGCAVCSETDLPEKAAALLYDGETRLSLGRAARACAQTTYSWAAIARQHKEAFARLSAKG